MSNLPPRNKLVPRKYMDTYARPKNEKGKTLGGGFSGLKKCSTCLVTRSPRQFELGSDRCMRCVMRGDGVSS